MSVNKAILIGRLGKDPELKDTKGGRQVCTFSLATSESWKDDNGQKQESTTWHNVVAWGKQGAVMAEYLQKGTEVYIEGRIDNRSYEDKDGVKKYRSEVVVQRFQFVGSKADNTGSDNATAPPQGDDDDLPF